MKLNNSTFYTKRSKLNLIFSNKEKTKLTRTNMENASFFIENKALFGSFPTQTQIRKLEDIGVRYFVNLTHPDESKITNYTTNYNYISYPIIDRSIPEDNLDFSRFIYTLCNLISVLKEGEKIYIHCKGGHGRSGLVVACITTKFFNISPDTALKHTTKCHSKRQIMRDSWRRIGSPQTPQQKEFVKTVCGIIKIKIGNILHPSSNADTVEFNNELLNTGLKYIQIDGESTDDLATAIMISRYNNFIL
jgi:protein-tyrosine phosphatase